ncbi:MAG: TetR/AcrR family transcriptional regulator [Bacteroidales bacterium]|nr:TetR/AcrR family transcriptional regulator [Bacteroidales bacterium]
MPRTEDQNKVIRNEKIQLIQDTALHLFAEEGFHSVSVQKIAKTAGISKGLLYNYFSSKEELLRTIIHDFVKGMYDFFDPDNEGSLTDEEFVFFIEKNFEIVKENPAQWKLYSALSMQKDVEKFLADEAAQLAPQVFVVLYNFFKNKNCEDPETEMLFFSSLLKGAIIQFVAAPFDFPIEKMKIKIIDFYKNKFKI